MTDRIRIDGGAKIITNLTIGQPTRLLITIKDTIEVTIALLTINVCPTVRIRPRTVQALAMTEVLSFQFDITATDNIY
ncbi:MAG: hypothetical protein ACC650_00895 [Gammaproteobacteria bacterium]